MVAETRDQARHRSDWAARMFDRIDTEHVETLRVGQDVVVEYSDEGEGPPIVLIHAGGFADWFLPTARILRGQRHRVVRFRRAGYGDLAPPPGLQLRDHATHNAAALDHLGLAGTHVVGHSSGALVALDLAAIRPDLVARLTLFEPAPGGPLTPPPPPTVANPAPPAAVPDDPFDAFMTLACGPDYLPTLADTLGEAGLRRARIESAYFLAEELPAVITWTFDADAAATITQPLTLAAGDASSPAYRAACDLLHELVPHAQILTIAGADHLYPLRAPTSFAALVTELGH